MTASFDSAKNLFNKKYCGQNYLFIYGEIYILNYHKSTCPETSTEHFLNVLLQNLMRMEHFEICTLKLI